MYLLVANVPAATITPVQPSPHEPDLSETLDAIYGAGNYFRIDDDTDQTWAPGQITVRALSTYAGALQSLGYCLACDGSDDVYFDQTFTVDGIFSTPLTVSGASTLFLTSQYTWFDHAQLLAFVGKVYSDPALNPDTADHMVTYGLSGLPGRFVLAFEDWLFADPSADKDYQDFIFEVTYATPPDAIVPTPEPGAVLTLFGGLAALLFFRRKPISRA